MTTLVRTRNPLDTLSMNPQPQRRRSTRIAAYEEEDGDFKFTRGSKRKKPTSAPVESAPPTKKSRTREAEILQDVSRIDAKRPARRKMSFSTPKEDLDPVKPSKRGSRKSTRSSLEKSQDGEANGQHETEDDGIDMVGAPMNEGDSKGAMESGKETTRIALPFSDTPVMNRNKELRRKTGSRRSSLGLRGRRASSLIDNGYSATPHQQVEASEFYKHIEAEGLPEPRRMKQLLTWCGERALGARPSHNTQDPHAVLSARAIQEAIQKDFSNRSEMSDWFNREDGPRIAAVKRPNPLNTENEARIRELEARIQTLKAERAQWKTLTETPHSLPPLLDPPGSPPAPSDIDASILDSESASILSSLGKLTSKDVASKASTRIKEVQKALEFEIDQFADGIHKLEQSRLTMEGVASKVLALSALRLEERERTEKEAVGARDLPIQEVLRSLSRIMPEGSSGAGSR